MSTSTSLEVMNLTNFNQGPLELQETFHCAESTSQSQYPYMVYMISHDIPDWQCLGQDFTYKGCE